MTAVSGDDDHFGKLVSRVPILKTLFDRSRVAAAQPSGGALLIEGPEGSGRRSLAFEIHNASMRAAAPFVELDCRDVPAELLESALFGYERGSFTGAITRKPGAFGEAKGGTLALLAAHEIPIDLQPRLLRVLRERETRAVGSNHNVPWAGSVIAITHYNLETLVERGLFRRDLFVELTKDGRLDIPPLSEHKDDVGYLLLHFLSELVGKELLTPEVVTRLENLSWPGNVRQLRAVANLIHHVRDRKVSIGSLVTELELLDVIARAPDDLGLREVYADLLTERHDPRGELISTQCHLARGVDKGLAKRLTRAEEKLLAAHGKNWNAEITVALSTMPNPDAEKRIELRRGFAELIRGPIALLHRLELVFLAAPTVTTLEIIGFGSDLRAQLTNRDLMSPLLLRVRRLVVILANGGTETAMTIANAEHLANLRELILWGAGSSEGNALFEDQRRYDEEQGPSIDETGIEAIVKSPYLKNVRMLMIDGVMRRQN